MFISSVNLLAVVVATIVSMAIGWLWYSPVLFGKAWLKALGRGEADVAAMKQGAPRAITLELVATLVKMYVLAGLVSFAFTDSAAQGALIGLWLWLGFVVTTNLSSVTFEGRSKVTYLIGITCQLVTLVVAGMILAVWQ